MKKINIKYPVLFAMLAVLLFSCKKFTDVNSDPSAANTNQVQTEYFINNSIGQAQQNPGVSERGFILYWAAAGHQISDADGATFSWGDYNDEWIGEYYSNQATALTYINSAITVAKQQMDAGTEKLYTKNLYWIARIWRAYMLSEMSDCFGPMPINGFQGVNPTFSDVKSVYYYALSELDSASAGINVNVAAADDNLKLEDPAYAYNWLKWQQYANSMRLRLAMRLSEVDAAKAKTEFEAAAATNNFITDNSATFGVKEAAGYNNLSGVYTRCWYLAPVSVTLSNLMVNLGGVTSTSQLPSVVTDATGLTTALSKVKSANYIGQYFPVQFTEKTNNPYSAYYMDGMPNAIDPRAFQVFYIPGNSVSPTFASGTCGAVDENTVDTFRNADAQKTKYKGFDAAYTWNPVPDGNWGTKGGVVNGLNPIYNIGGANGKVPGLQQKFRTQTATRVFFGPWETYFLLAEGAERGWASPVTAQTAYETGISKSFDYWGVSANLATYLASTDYNRVGTSVNWTNTTETTGFTAAYVDGASGIATTKTINYPVNNLYKNGTVRNDHMTKIITQKFIAQTPWLPLETWNDHRRLGLPFFENVVLESPIQTLPTLNSGNLNTSNQQFFPQRMKYPSSLRNNNVDGYNGAVGLLGGADAVLTPIWWAQH